jgi:superfamily I DNA/RNA helicase
LRKEGKRLFDRESNAVTSLQAPPAIIPTDEQAAIVDAARSGTSLRVMAFAGTGKTTTLQLVADALAHKRVLYLVFNRAQATAAKARFRDRPNVVTATAHGLAFRYHGCELAHRLSRSESAAQATWIAFMRQRNALAEIPVGEHARAYRTIVETVQRFVASADARIAAKHVPPSEGLDTDLLASLARRLWLSLESNDELPITHDFYLKGWQLRNEPLPNVDVVLYDEAQDATPAMLAIVERQVALQRIYCGDVHQQLYEFRGAVNALGSLDLPAFPLTRTRRFGSEIAKVANAILAAKGEKLRLVGTSDEIGRASLGYAWNPNVVLSRTNLGLVEQALRLGGQGSRIFIRGATDPNTGIAGNGAGELMNHMLSVFDLWQGKRPNNELFAGFSSFDDLREAVREDGGERFRPYVRIVEQHGNGVPTIVAKIRDACVPSETNANVILSTVHRYKGEEARIVALADDFRPFATDRVGEKPATYDETEANIAYVACTRSEAELWYGGAHRVLKASTEARGIELPATQVTLQPRAGTISLRPSIANSTSARAAQPAPPKQSYKDLVPGAQRRHPNFGVVTIDEATPNLITIITATGETKQISTLIGYPKLASLSPP